MEKMSPKRVSAMHFLSAVFIIILSTSPVVIPGTGMVSAGELSLQQRIERIEAEKQIRDIIMQYGEYLDSKNFAAYSKLFAKEGSWSGGTTDYVPVKGPEAIRATMEKAFSGRVYDPEHITNLHLISNIKIDVDGDRAKGYCKWIVMSRNDKDEPYVRLIGHYEDVYIREQGHWKFLSRVARREIP